MEDKAALTETSRALIAARADEPCEQKEKSSDKRFGKCCRSKTARGVKTALVLCNFLSKVHTDMHSLYIVVDLTER